MADIGQNILLQLGAALDLGGHMVEILRQTADFIVVLNFNLYIVVARGNLLRAVAQLADGVGEPAAEQHGQQQIQHQQKQRDRREDGAQHLGGNGNLCKACRDNDAVLPIGRQPAHAHLHRGADLDNLVKLAVLKQLLAQLDGNAGIDIVAEIPAEGTGALMQQTGVHTLIRLQAAQGGIREIDTAAIHVDFLVLKGLTDAAPEFFVQGKAEVAPVGDGRVRLVNQRGDGCRLALQLGADVAVILRLQREGDDAPDQQQRKKGNATDE